MRRLALVLALASLAAGCHPAAPIPAAGPTSAAARAAPKRPVLVTIVVDQLAAWVTSERVPLLPAGGGFARLRREGTWVRSLSYEHAVTDTSPGHSALYTGAVPAVSGIFANERLGDDGQPTSILEDRATHLVTEVGAIDVPSSSLARLRVETLADRLRNEHPDAVIVALSLKDRGALFGGGRTPTAAVWFDVKGNRFVTSTAFARALPPWATRPASDALRMAELATWDVTDRGFLESHAATPDAEAGEGDIPGFGTVFPHRLSAAVHPAYAFRTSPFADDVLLSLALSALDSEHAGEHDTLLAISLSANDYIGHTFGPDSWEAWDELMRFDAALAHFLAALDVRFGPDGYSLLLTGDHGTTAMPEAGRHAFCEMRTPDPWGRACGVAHRVLPDELAKAIRARAKEALGPGEWVLGVSDPYVYLSPAAHALDSAHRAALDDALRRAILATPGVARLYDTHALPLPCPPLTDESLDALVCRSVAPGAGDLYVVLTPGSFFDPTVVVGKGSSHGSPYVFDRTVPLFVRAPGRVPEGRAIDGATFNTFAVTAASLLAIAPPHDAAPAASLASRVR